MSRRLVGLVLWLVLVGWQLQGCGSGGGEMSGATASTLQRDVDTLVAATDASRWDAAVAALDRLAADVASAQAVGGLSEDRAAEILAVRQRVLEDLLRIRGGSPSPAPSPPQSRSTTTQASPSATSDGNASGGKSGKPNEGKPKDKHNGEKGKGKKG